MTTNELITAIRQLKKETDTVVLAHTYQPPEIIDVADIAGDSFKLSAAAKDLPNRRVILCGVGFMAETVKILSPEKTVVLAAPKAACPMASQIDPMDVMAFKQQHPDVAVCCYVNTTAPLKAVSDVCVTSSSAVEIVAALPNREILFIPDKNLGSYVAACLPDKHIITWNGYCPVHDQVTPEHILELKKEYPQIPIAIHPECKPEVVELCDVIGSTADIIKFAKAHEGDVIIATEKGVAEYLNLHETGEKKYIQACGDLLVCPDMKMTSLQDLYKALKGEGGREIVLDEDIAQGARSAIDRMLALGN
ncbi:MAG: quinolinate synthase NadA [Clostridia bacterium]|nr:quinolinate synthase NadA [Clostridia bacterium]